MGEFETSPLGRVTVYSIQGCPHCVQAKATLGRLGVPVCDVDVGRHTELRARVKELTGRSTVPQIFFNSVHIGGNDDLQKLVRFSVTTSEQFQNPNCVCWYSNLSVAVFHFNRLLKTFRGWWIWSKKSLFLQMLHHFQKRTNPRTQQERTMVVSNF